MPQEIFHFFKIDSYLSTFSKDLVRQFQDNCCTHDKSSIVKCPPNEIESVDH